MKIFQIRLKSSILWKGDRKFPRILRFGNLEGIKLISPFLYYLIPVKYHQDNQPSKSRNSLNFSSSNLYFLLEKDVELPDDFMSNLEKNLEALRYVSKQSDMGILWTSSTLLETSVLPKLDVENLHSFSFGTPPYNEKTAITLDMLSRLSTSIVRLRDVSRPIYTIK